MHSHFWFPQLWCSLSLPTIKQVLLLLLCSILMLFPSVPGLPFPLHCLISASYHIVSIPADPPISQALSHPTHHAHNSRITHVKYALVSSLSKSTMLCVPFAVRIKSPYPQWLNRVSTLRPHGPPASCVSHCCPMNPPSYTESALSSALSAFAYTPTSQASEKVEKGKRQNWGLILTADT